jgi:hypothetical protein
MTDLAGVQCPAKVAAGQPGPVGQPGHLNGPGRIRRGQGRCRAPGGHGHGSAPPLHAPGTPGMADRTDRPAPRARPADGSAAGGAVVLESAARLTGQRGCRRSPARRRRARIARRRRARTARRRRIAPEGFPAWEQLGVLELEVLHRHSSFGGHGVSFGDDLPRARPPGGCLFGPERMGPPGLPGISVAPGHGPAVRYFTYVLCGHHRTVIATSG